MAYQPVDIGAAPNDGTGDPIRDAFDKVNDNFVELYAGLTGLLDFKGSTDCSANPNYPAASKGDFYLVSVAGKIGGASGIVVEVGDSYFATADNAGGTQAGVGTSWTVLQGNITAYLPLSGGTLTGDLIVPDEAYDATAWNGSLEVPTKNAVRDKIETLSGGGTVTTTGSPASGNLTKFSGATSIVNGDLSGDVTTSGTLAATIANSAVTLAKIANAAANSKLLGSGASGSGAAYAELTLGTNLSMSGTTLNATGGSSGWALAGTGQTATGVWDFAVDGAKTNIDFSGLSGFSEFMIVGRAVTRTNSTVSAVRVSVASTFYTASGDYVSEATTGVNTNIDFFGSHSTNSTAARDFYVWIRPSVSGGGAVYSISTDGVVRKFIASSGVIDALRCFAYSGGTTTGGKIYCYAK